MVFKMDGLQGVIDEVAKLIIAKRTTSKPKQLDLSLAFKQPDEVKKMTPQQVQELIVNPVNELLGKCGCNLRLQRIKWCDVDRGAGKVWGRLITDFSVSEGNAQGDVLRTNAYVLAPEDQTNDTMALIHAANIKFTIHFKDGPKTMSVRDIMKHFGGVMSSLDHKIDPGQSLDVQWMQASVSQFPLYNDVFVPKVNPHGDEMLVVLFTRFGITAGIASGRHDNFVLVNHRGKKYLLAAKKAQGICEDEDSETGKRKRDDGHVFIAEGVDEGWFALVQLPLRRGKLEYTGQTRSINKPMCLIECRIEKGPEASDATIRSALKDLPLAGLELDTTVKGRVDFFKVWRIDGDEGALDMKDVNKMLDAQRGMYESLNAPVHTREKLQNLGVLEFSAMTQEQIEFFKGLGCSTDTMTLSEQKKGFKFIKDLDKLFEAFTLFQIMTKHGNFARRILEIHAENKDLALDLGKELLNLVADDPDTVEAKFPKILASEHC